jgi:hypothetical protein
MRQQLTEKLKIIPITLCLFFTFLAGGCVQGAPTEQPVPIFTVPASETPTVTPTSTPAKPTLPPTRLIPTPSLEQVERAFTLLEDANCQLPCYWGIVPGETTFEQAKVTFETLGAVLLGSRTYSFNDGELLQYTYTWNFYEATQQSSQLIDLYVFDDVIFRMEIHLRGQSFNQTFHKYWGKYSITNLLEEYSVPDAVYVDPESDGGNDTWAIYQKQGIYIGSLGIGIERDDNLVCPGVRENITNTIFILLFAPEYSDMLTASIQFDEIRAFGFENGLMQIYTDSMVLIDTELGIGPQEFYERMMADPDACFERLSVEP